MKRLLLITSAIIIALTASARQVVCIETGEIVASDVSTKPIRNVEQLDNGVRVTYRFSHMALDSISPESSALTIAFESFGTTFTPNYPALPARMDAIKIPADCDPTITVESAIYEDYFFELAPAPELELDKVQCTYATNAEFQFSQIHYDYGPDEKKLTSYENVVIYAPNKIPYIKNKWGSNNSLDSFSFTQSTLNLTYTISTDVKAQITITKATTGNIVLKVPLNPEQRSVSIDISTLKGTYIVSFVVNGQVYESKNLYLQ